MKRLGGALLVCGFVAVLWGPVPGVPAVAEETRPFSGQADAAGTSTSVVVPDYLIVTTLAEIGAPASQAVLESNGNRQSFASLPYPGDTVVSAPGLVAGFGGPSGVPGYPLYVNADASNAEGNLADPAGLYSLTAKAAPSAVSAVARAGSGGTGDGVARAVADTSVKALANGDVIAAAMSEIEGISVGGGLLRIASVTTSAQTVLKAKSAKPVTTRSLEVDGATVAGQRVAIGPDGIDLLEQSIPVAGVELEKSLNDALRQAGIAVRTVSGDKLAGGGASNVLEIRTEQVLPVPGNPVGVLTYRFGRTSASVLGTSGGALLPPLLPPLSPGQPALASQSTGAPAASVGTPTPSAANAEPATVTSPGVTRARRLVARPSVLARDLRTSIRFFYVIIATAGGALLAAGFLWRKGAKRRWTS